MSPNTAKFRVEVPLTNRLLTEHRWVDFGDGNKKLIRRVNELRKIAKCPVVLLAAIPGDKTVELALHARFAEERIDPNDEWFRGSDRLRDFVASIGRSAA